MKQLVVKPACWPCTLLECPPGLFLFNNELCFKSEYALFDNEGNKLSDIEVYCDNGEAFWGGVKTHEEKEKLIVQPLVAAWEES
jgi:hypothetical protein